MSASSCLRVRQRIRQQRRQDHQRVRRCTLSRLMQARNSPWARRASFSLCAGALRIRLYPLAFADVWGRAHHADRTALDVVFGHHAVALDPQPAIGGAHPVLQTGRCCLPLSRVRIVAPAGSPSSGCNRSSRPQVSHWPVWVMSPGISPLHAVRSSAARAIANPAAPVPQRPPPVAAGAGFHPGHLRPAGVGGMGGREDRPPPWIQLPPSASQRSRACSHSASISAWRALN